MVCGIDPGISGAIYFLTEAGEESSKVLMPNTEGLMDIPEIARVLKAGQPTHVFLEKAQSFPKQGVSSSFNYGRGFGSLEGILGTLGLPYTLVPPSVWTRDLHAGLSKDLSSKQKSLIVAKRLFPNLDLRATPRCRIFHEGYVDALLIAEFGRRKLLVK